MKTLISNLEILEPRLAPAGVVTLTTVNGVLTVTGTTDSNNILITESAPGEWRVMETAPSGTTFRLNGAAAVASVVMPAQNTIQLNLLGGALDILQINNLKLAGDLNINGGDGVDQINIYTSHVVGKVGFDGGNGDDYFNMDTSSSIGGAVSLKGGAGADTVEFYGSQFGAGVTVDLGSGANGFYMSGTATVFGNLTISAAGTPLGTQSVNIGGTGSVGGNLTVKSTSSPLFMNLTATPGDNLRIGGGLTVQTGAGNDTINMANTLYVGGSFTINAGNGNNYLTQNSGTLTAGTIKYTGGTGADWLQFIGANVVTGAGTSINLGSGGINRLDLSCTSSVRIAGALNLVGGTGVDDLIVQTPVLNITGTLSFNAAAGTNSMTFKPVNANVGAVNYTGGNGSDNIDIGDYLSGAVTRITVSGGITSSLGAGDNVMDLRDTVIQGAVRITSSSASTLLERVRLNEAIILGNLDINLSGAAGSRVMVDDSTINGATVISTGAGNDTIEFESLAPGANLTTFVGSVRILMGSDADYFIAGASPFAANQGVNFLGTLLVDGGTSGDAAGFQVGYGNAFAVPATVVGVETVT